LYKDIKKLEDDTIGRTKEKLSALFEPSLNGGIVKGDKVEKLFSLWLNHKEFSDLQIPFQAVATNLITSEKVIFKDGKLANALRASMSIPSFFKPAIINNIALVDGGVSDPVPVDVLKSMGADIIIAVNLDNCEKRNGDNEKIDSMSKISLRSFDILRHYLGKYSSAGADIIISPALSNKFSSWTEYFTHNTGPEIMKIGVEETEKIIPKLKELMK
jgi:NTE family protein